MYIHAYNHSSTDDDVVEYSNEPIKKKWRNVMELLVIEEVEEQIKLLPLKVSQHIKVHEVIAYALNRLPGLYATSKRGWQRQWHNGKTEYHHKIATAVRQGIIAVQRDLLRDDVPLGFEEENKARAALNGLKDLLQRQNLSWDNLVSIVENTLMDTVRGKITWRKPPEQEIFDWEKHPQYQGK